MSAIYQYQVYVRATPEQVWQAIIDPAMTRQYFFASAAELPDAPGPYRYAMPDGSIAVAGTVEAIEPPRELTLTWQVHYDSEMESEPVSRVEWRIDPAGEGISRIYLVHRNLGRSPKTASSVGNGWHIVLDGLKTLLETGKPLGRVAAPEPAIDTAGEQHRAQAMLANNSTWDLLTKADRSAAETDEMIDRAHAAAYHWARAARRQPVNETRADYLLAKVWAAAGFAGPAQRYAQQCLDGTRALGLADFDLAYAHEAVARAAKVAGNDATAAEHWAAAKAVPIANDEDREILEEDLAEGP